MYTLIIDGQATELNTLGLVYFLAKRVIDMFDTSVVEIMRSEDGKIIKKF